jgi:hypothetical protein
MGKEETMRAVEAELARGDSIVFRNSRDNLLVLVV